MKKICIAPILTSFRRMAFLSSVAISSAHLANAQIISVNFDGSTDPLAPLVDSSVLAGAPGVRVNNWNPWGNWNNDINTPPVLGDTVAGNPAIVDDSGTTITGFTATFTGQLRTGQRQVGTGFNDALFFGNQVDTFGGQESVVIDGIPYTSYDLYVYMYDDRDGRAGSFTVGATTFFARGLADQVTGTEGGGNPLEDGTGYVISVDSTGDGANITQGNYVRFRGLTDSAITLGLSAVNAGNLDRNKVAGFQIVETLANLPVVDASAATNVTEQAATVNGNLLSNGVDGDASTLTIYWGTSDGMNDPLAWDNMISAGTLTTPGQFSAELLGLASDTTYYFRAFAENAVGGEFALVSESFATLPPLELPEVENLAASAVTSDSATLNGELLNNGDGATPSNIVIYWGVTDGGTDQMAWANNSPAGSLTTPGTFSADITGLSQNTVYFYRAFASNSEGDDWASSTETFATLLPEVGAISLNFVRGSSGATALDEVDIAGVIPVSRWNNTTIVNANAETGGMTLTNDLGNDTSAVATWQSGGASWSVGIAGSGTPENLKMMTGYLDQTGDGTGVHMITVTDIPYEFYNVYLYHSSSGGPNRSARYSANDTDVFVRNLDPANTFDGFVNAQYDSLAESVNLANPAGNFVLWESLSGDLTIEGQGLSDVDGGAGDGARRAPIQGIQIVPASPPVRVILCVEDSGGSDLVFSWDNQPGMIYDLVSNTGLATEPSTWDILQGDILADPSGTNVLPITRPSDPATFFALIESVAPPLPPLFSADFENDNGGFTFTSGSGTDWQYGLPNSTGIGGTVDAGNVGSELNCWGTNLTGFYADPTVNSCLRSPAIDLTNVAGAVLTFAYAIDLDVDDSVSVNIIDDATNTVIAADIVTITDDDINTSVWQATTTIDIPAAALGQAVRIEWCLSGTGGPTDDFLGWYIDDVVVRPL